MNLLRNWWWVGNRELLTWIFTLFTSDEHSSYQIAMAKVYKVPEPASTDKVTESENK